MDSAYLYSGTYTSVLANRLLTEAQRELLLSSSSLTEVRTILTDTVLAPFLGEGNDIKVATQLFLEDQVALLRRLAPDETALAILLLRNDYYNLKQIAIGKLANESDEVLLGRCRNLGTIAPARLLQLAHTNTLRFTYPELGALYRTITESPNFSHAHVDEAMLTHLHALVAVYPDSFVARYVAVLIDLYNLTMRLRVLFDPDSDALSVTGEFVVGGSMTNAGLASLESTLIRLDRFGGANHWREARETFEKTHDFSALDRARDNYLHRFLKTESIEIHSPAPLFAYYHALTEHMQFIEAVSTAHAVGLDNNALRAITRHSLLDYAY